MAAARLAVRYDRPFELLLGLEEAILGPGRTEAGVRADSWAGIAFRVARCAFVAPREEVREVLAWPGVSRLPRAQPWLLGLANVRGQLIAVSDLGRWSGIAASPPVNAGRVIVVNHPEIPAGLLIHRVEGFRRFTGEEAVAPPDGIPARMAPFVGGAFERGGERWTVLGLRALVASESFLQAAC
ncbi:MAG TPA: chemotaxis protein CheW [Gammaproteobacteria bacterium]|nr:chemotaxis protein CheW [Gammaproteobacteria bacterium]